MAKLRVCISTRKKPHLQHRPPSLEMANATYPLSREHHETVLRDDGGNVESLKFLAAWHLERQNLSFARSYLGQLVNVRKNEVSIWQSFSIACALAGELEESYRALAEVVRLTEKPEEDIRIKYCQGLLYECRGKLMEAQDLYYRGIDMCESDFERKQGEHESAASEGDFEMENAAFKCMSELKDLRTEILLRVASIKKDRGELAEAVIVADLAIRESSAAAPGLRAQVACMRGNIFAGQHQLLQSEMSYREALRLVPGHCTALERLGGVYLRYRECVPNAVTCFFQAIDSNPLSHTSWYMLGRCYTAVGRHADAIEAYQRSLNIEPNVAETWCSLGILYYAHLQCNEAQGAFRRALRLDPKMPEGWYNLGVLCESEGQAREAHQCFVKARQFGLGDRLNQAGMELIDTRLVNS